MAVATIILSVGKARVGQKLPVRLPICNFDAKTGMLCANCESRLHRGEISKADVEASKAVVMLADKLPELGRVTLKRAFEVGGAYVLEFERQDLAAIRSNSSIYAELEGALQGKVWVVAAGSSDRKFLEDIFFPAKVLTVNTVWLRTVARRQRSSSLHVGASGASGISTSSERPSGRRGESSSWSRPSARLLSASTPSS